AAVDRSGEAIRRVQIAVNLEQAGESVALGRDAKILDVARRGDPAQQEARDLRPIEIDAAGLIQLLARSEEKRLVLHDRPAERAAPLIALQLRSFGHDVTDRQRRRGGNIRGVETVVASEPERT